MGTSTSDLILSKCLALVEKTKWRVSQIDTSDFPTISSEIPRTLLWNSLASLGEKRFWQAMSPEAFYHALIQFQDLVAMVEESSSDRISWPLVSYCDHFWQKLFPAGNDVIFYSVFDEHNYGISSFSNQLRYLLDPILPPVEIQKIINGQQVYCLQIASLEDENLPLYANIGHEFGHAVFNSCEQDLLKILVNKCATPFQGIQAHLVKIDAGLAKKRTVRAAMVVREIAVELFCDQVGAMIAGPAFLLSLSEMSWGSDTKVWSARLSPQDSRIRAYPSFDFRFYCVNSYLQLATFCTNLKKRIASCEFRSKGLDDILSAVNEISPASRDYDFIAVHPNQDLDASAIQEAIELVKSELEAGLSSFLEQAEMSILSKFRTPDGFSSVDGDDVFELLKRLDSDILPNIIPNKTLLGNPAAFSTILNASALFRMQVLATRSDEKSARDINMDIQKVERLTAKALEVSYIQREFRKWEAQP